MYWETGGRVGFEVNGCSRMPEKLRAASVNAAKGLTFHELLKEERIRDFMRS